MNWIDRLNALGNSWNIGGMQLEVLSWAHAAHLRDNVLHRHTFFEVCQVGTHGRGVFTSQGREHPLRRGDLFIARPGEVHRIQNTTRPQMELFWVSFSLQLNAPAAAGHTGMGGLWHAFAHASTSVARLDTRTAALWTALRETAGGLPVAGQELQLRHLTSALLLSIAQAGAGEATPAEYATAAQPDPAAQTARLAVRYIHDNLHRSLPVAEVAAHSHVSPRHLSRLLAHYTGISPAEYIERARLDRARHLLRTSALSIKEIARDSGYGSVQHFTRVFTQRCGLPPGQYRRSGAPGLPHLDVPNIQNPGSLV